MAGRRNRLGVPAVNPDPQPPNADPMMLRTQQQKQQGGGRQNQQHPSQGQFTGRQQGPPGQLGGHVAGERDAAGNPLKRPPTTYGQPMGSPYSQGQGQPDPRDATYYANVARLQAAQQQGLRSIGLEQTYANTDYTRSATNLALNRQQDTQSLAAGLFKSGLSSSGYGNVQGTNLALNYGQQESGLLSDKNRQDAAREAAKQALISGLPMDMAAEYAAAADRFTQLQAQQAKEGEGINTKKDLKAIQKLLKQKKKGNKGGGGGGHGGNNGNGHGGHGGNH